MSMGMAPTMTMTVATVMAMVMAQALASARTRPKARPDGISENDRLSLESLTMATAQLNVQSPSASCITDPSVPLGHPPLGMPKQDSRHDVEENGHTLECRLGGRFLEQ